MEFEFVKNAYKEFELKRYGSLATDKRGALRNSIKKWKTIVEFFTHLCIENKYGVNDFIRNVYIRTVYTCNLCQLYLINSCDGCPVFQKTGRKYCGKTPITNIEHHGLTLARATRELEFLQKLYKELYK